MRISKAVINNFGKLKDFEITFTEGLNVICGNNEAGKSTIVAFVKSTLYGITNQKKNVRDNDRKRYMPWDAQSASGELQIIEDPLIYNIRRSFGEKKSQDKIEVLNGVSGEEIAFESMDKPGKFLFGIDESTYEKTALIRQLSSEITKEGSDEIQKYLTNLQGSGDASVSYNQAKKELEDYRKGMVNTQRKPGILDQLKNLYHENVEKFNSLNSMKHDFETRLENKHVFLDEEVERVSRLRDIIGEEIESIKSKRMKQRNIREIYAKKEMEKSAAEKESASISLMSDFLSMDPIEANKDFHKISEEHIRMEGYAEKVRKYEVIQQEIIELKHEKERLETSGFNKLEYIIEDAEGVFERINDLKHQSQKENTDQEFGRKRANNRTAMAAFGFLFILALVGALMTQMVPVPLAMIFLLPVYFFYRRSSNLSHQWRDFSSEKEKISEEIQRLEKRLVEIYRTYEVKNIREIREKFQKLRMDYGKIDTKLSEKERLLRDYHEENSKDQLNRSNALISTLLQKYRCKDKEQLKETISKCEALKEKSGQYTEKMERIIREEADLLNEINQLEKDILEEVLMAYEHASEMIKGKIDVLRKRWLLYETEMKSADEALEALNQAFQKFHMEFGSKLNTSAAKFLKKITLDKYRDMMISKDFEVRVSEEEGKEVHHVEYLSNGTWDQIYFSVRMGIADLIFEKINKKIPIILDDTFVQYDHRRVGAVLDFLYEYSKTNQVILFTCHKREMEYLKKYKDVNVIEIRDV